MDNSLVFLVLLLIVIALLYWIERKAIAIKRFLRRECGVKWQNAWGLPYEIEIKYRDIGKVKTHSLGVMKALLREIKYGNNAIAPFCWIAHVWVERLGGGTELKRFIHAHGWKPEVTHASSTTTIFNKIMDKMLYSQSIKSSGENDSVDRDILTVVEKSSCVLEYQYRYSLHEIAEALRATRGISKSEKFAQIRAFAEKADENFKETHQPAIFSEEPVAANN